MANGNKTNDATTMAAPVFVTEAMRSSQCSIAAPHSRAQGLELFFGVRETLDGRITRQVSRLTHRLLLDPAAATHLEEALTRVLGVPADAGRRSGVKE